MAILPVWSTSTFRLGKYRSLTRPACGDLEETKQDWLAVVVVSAPKEQISTSQNGGMPDELNGVLDR